MKTLTTLLFVIILALLGMGFYLNDKIDRLEARTILADTLYVKTISVQDKIIIDNHFGSFTEFGSNSLQVYQAGTVYTIHTPALIYSNDNGFIQQKELINPLRQH